jgi:hypothetical protein
MGVSSSSGASVRARFSIWRIVTWLLLLLAVFGILQYSVHAWHVGAALGQAGSQRQASLGAMLAWDVAYLAVACVSVMVAAGALLHRAWARPALRVVAAVLAAWLLVTAIMLIAHWASFNNHSSELLAQSGLGDAGRALLTRVRRNYLVAMCLKAAAVPVLAWLAWRLGAPRVRAQFAARAPRRPR